MGLLDGLFKQGGGALPDRSSLQNLKSDQEIANWVRSKVEDIRSSAGRIAHESIWMQNCAYTLGFNGVFYNNVTRSFAPINRASSGIKKNRINVNKILPNLQNRLARLTKTPPKYDVRPNDAGQEAKDNARLKLDILNAKWDDLKLNPRRQQLLMWTQQCGHAYLGVFWDDCLGKLIQDPMTGEQVYEGDIRVDVISPFEIFPDPMARDMSDGMYWIRAKVRPLSYFYTHYGESGREVKTEETWLLSSQFEGRINTMNTRGPSSGNEAIKDSCIELTYFERPSIFNPKGRMIVAANGIKLLDKELPCGKVPLVKFDDILVAGKYYSEAVVTHVRPIQDQYNQIIRRRSDWANRNLSGKLLSPRGNELAREALDDQSGEVVQYTVMPNAPNGGEPKALDMPTIPSYAYNEEDKLDAMFSEIFGISDVSKGELPSASIPGIGIQLLLEADDTRMGVMIENHENAYSDVGKLVLDYVQQYYEAPRKIKYAGDQAYVIKEIRGEDLKGENDVIVIRGSTVPGSKVLRRQEILNAYQQGLLGDPADPQVRQKVLRDIEFGDTAEIWIDSALDKQVSKREIEAVESGELPVIHEADNHGYLWQELNRYRKSDKFLALDAEKQDILLSAQEEHLRLMQVLSGSIPAELTPDQEAMVDQEASVNAQQEADRMAAQGMPLENTANVPMGGENL